MTIRPEEASAGPRGASMAGLTSEQREVLIAVLVGSR